MAKKSVNKARADGAGAAKFIDAFLIDLNGVERGKRLPAKDAAKIEKSSLRFPRSLIGVDIWGNDVFDNGLVVDTGDSDGLCPIVRPGLKPCPWSATPTLQAQVMMAEANGAAFGADPRQLLINARERAKKMGLTPVAAVELEFYLLTRDFDELGRPLAPKGANGKRVREGRVYAMAELDAYAAFLSDLYAAADAQGLPLDAAVIEAGPSQFEVNLKHQADIVVAADQAVWLKRAIRGVASKHGLAASFMAKPFGDLPGNGMHAHMSMLNARGANAFETEKTLLSAIAGLIATMQEGMILFAPHLNSWRRFQEGSHAPTRAAWGRENRTAPIRIPADGGANTRFEHRVAGADANPYLVLAAILSGALFGLEKKLTPPPALTGNVYASAAPRLDIGWRAALSAFEDGQALNPAFGPLFTQVYGALKRQEMRAADRRVTDFEYDSYLFAF
ncbi:MAG TPA: glutamine synthetase [Parvularcula sp.]|nr:glutamine synthetase [Parvularcula sp.]HBS30263.1 glutamine synthetase [Parvularcula sp.]